MIAQLLNLSRKFPKPPKKKEKKEGKFNYLENSKILFV